MAWEADFLLALHQIRTPFLDTVMNWLSLSVEHGILGICVGLILLIFAKTRRTGCKVLIAMALAYIFANLILKNAVHRVRPYDEYAFLLPLGKIPHDWSFPSGHAVNAFAAATVIFLDHKKAGVFALILAALVAFSRLYNSVHYPTDVLAGIVIGVGFALMVHYWLFPACENSVRRLRRSKED